MPLNYIDVISRMQIEDLLRYYEPTLLFIEHDHAFCYNIATKKYYYNEIKIENIQRIFKLYSLKK